MFRGAILAWIVVWLLPCIAGAQTPPSETLLPDSTQGWLSVADLHELNRAMEQTQFADLFNEPSMRPFVDDFNRQLQGRRTKLLGADVEWSDLQAIARGEVALAVVHPPQRPPVRVFMVDVTGRLAETRAVMDRVIASLTRQGARGRFANEEKTLVVYTKGNATLLAYFLKNNLLCTTRDLQVAQGILAAIERPRTDSLQQHPAFHAVAQRLAEDQALVSSAPHARWFVQPLGFAEARRQLDPDYKPLPGREDRLEMLRQAGFAAILGAGGILNLRAGDYDLLHRMAIYAPEKSSWRDSMNCLALLNEGDLTAKDQPWIGTDLATYAAVSMDLSTAFDHVGPIFNHTVGQGKKDVWETTLQRLKSDKYGPQVDVKAEIFDRLSHRCTIVTDPKTPIEPDSERSLFAIEIDTAAAEIGASNLAQDGTQQTSVAAHANLLAVRTAIDRILLPEVSEQTAVLHRGFVGEVDVWELKDPPPKPSRTLPTISIQSPGGNDLRVEPPKRKVRESEALCVAHGHLIYSTHLSLLKKVLESATAGRSLASDPEYQVVTRHLDRQIELRGWTEVCLRRFCRTAADFQSAYQMAQAGKVSQSNGLLGRLLSWAAELGYDQAREPLDFRKLPPYDDVNRHLQPGGTVGRVEANGWFLVSFTLAKPTSQKGQGN